MLLKSQHDLTLHICIFFFFCNSTSLQSDFSKCNFAWSFKVNVFGSFLVGREIGESPCIASKVAVKNDDVFAERNSCHGKKLPKVR